MKEQKRAAEGRQLERVAVEDFRAFVKGELEGLLRLQAIGYVRSLLEEEMVELCGPAFSHKAGKDRAHRGGSEQGWIAIQGQRVAMRKPRARRDGAEVPLRRYAALQSMDNLGEFVGAMMLNGISTRRYNRVIKRTESDLGLSKSEASRQFVKQSREALNILNTRSFPGLVFWALVIDGVQFGPSHLITALGVDQAGNKHTLGVSEGSTENAELCCALLRRIMNRHITFADRILVVLDGSPALHRAVRDTFGEKVEIQRCLIHKRRNVESKLAKHHHRDLKLRMNQAFHCNTLEDAEKAFRSVHAWLAEFSHEAAVSLQEGMPELLTLHRIGMPPPLRKSFHTTNLIESAISVARDTTSRVKRWRRDTDQLSRWCAAGLLAAEEQFRAVRGHRHIQKFLEKFENRVDLKQAV